MKIEIERSLSLPLSAAAGWTLIQNIEDIATCLPGAKITERVDATHYKGTVAVKLGPANIIFKGEIEITGLDPAARTIQIRGRGSDTTGTSGASLDLKAEVTETGPASCELRGRSEVSVTGKVAAFGARLMNAVTEQLLKVFFAKIQERADKAAAETAAAEAEASMAAEPETSAAPPTPTPAPAAEPAQLDALAFIWSVIVTFLRGLFGRTKTG